MEVSDIPLIKNRAEFSDTFLVKNAGNYEYITMDQVVGILKIKVKDLVENLNLDTSPILQSFRDAGQSRELNSIRANIVSNTLFITIDSNFSELLDNDKIGLFLKSSLVATAINNVSVVFRDTNITLPLTTPIHSDNLIKSKVNYFVVVDGATKFYFKNEVPQNLIVLVPNTKKLSTNSYALCGNTGDYLYIGDSNPTAEITFPASIDTPDFETISVVAGSYQIKTTTISNITTTGTANILGEVKDNPLEADALNINIYRKL